MRIMVAIVGVLALFTTLTVVYSWAGFAVHAETVRKIVIVTITILAMYLIMIIIGWIASRPPPNR